MKNFLKVISVILTFVVSLSLIGCGNEKVTDKIITITMGEGQEAIEKKGTYTGEVDKNGKPTGKGVFKSSNAQGIKWAHEGEFKNGVMEGKGVVTFDNGHKHEGNYHKGLRTGQGKETLNGKSIYEGGYKDDLRHGKGKMYHTETGILIYEGDFSDNLPHGKGKLYNMKTGKLAYEGELKKALKCGYGKEYNSDGTKVVYEGHFDNNLPNGKGKVYKEDGSIKYEGNLVNGYFIGPAIGLNEKTNALEWEYSVAGTKTFKTIGNKQAGGIFIAVFVDVKNNSSFARHMGNEFFLLVDENGRVFNPTNLSFDYHEATNFRGNTNYQDINPGISLSSIPFFFDVPEDSKTLYLVTTKLSPSTNAIKIK